MFISKSSISLISTGICLLAQICFAAETKFSATTVYQAGQPVYGLDWGDFDPCHPGNEVACLLKDGSILELSRTSGGWNTYVRHTGGMNISSRPTIDIGDAYAGNAGNEIVSDGGEHIVMVYYDSNSGWTSGLLFDNFGMTGTGLGARIGDFDPRYSGDEIFHIYEAPLDFSNGTSLRVIGPNSPVWNCAEENIFSAEVGMDSAIGDFDPLHTGREIVVVTEMGPAYKISGSLNGQTWQWTQTLMWNDEPNAGWVAKVADIDNSGTTEEIVYGTRYNNRIMLSKYESGSQQPPQVLFTGNAVADPENMWDIAVGNVLTESTTLEIVGVDNTGSVYLVDYDDGTWGGRTIFRDKNGPLYAVIVGDFLPGWKGDEILVAGQSGRITMLAAKFSADLTMDDIVNLKDFAELAAYWLQPEPPVDIAPWPYMDGIVDMKDLAALAEDWLLWTPNLSINGQFKNGLDGWAAYNNPPQTYVLSLDSSDGSPAPCGRLDLDMPTTSWTDGAIIQVIDINDYLGQNLNVSFMHKGDITAPDNCFFEYRPVINDDPNINSCGSPPVFKRVQRGGQTTCPDCYGALTWVWEPYTHTMNVTGKYLHLHFRLCGRAESAANPQRFLKIDDVVVTPVNSP